MDDCDYRAHYFLASSLHQIVQDDTCDRCRRGAAFQLSLFHRLGFGPRATDGEAAEWLQASGITKAELGRLIEELRVWKPKNASVTKLEELGYRPDLPGQYQRDSVLEEVESYYRRLSAAREQALGRAHFSTLNNRYALAEVLIREESYKDACEVAVQMTELEEANRPQRMAINSLLARLWRELGDAPQAELALLGLLNSYDDGNTLQLDHQIDLAYLLQESQRSAEALPLALKALEKCLAELGPGHSTTFRARRCLAAMHDAEGQHDKAVEMREQLVKEQSSSEFDRLRVDESKVLVQDLATLGVPALPSSEGTKTHSPTTAASRGSSKVVTMPVSLPPPPSTPSTTVPSGSSTVAT